MTHVPVTYATVTRATVTHPTQPSQLYLARMLVVAILLGSLSLAALPASAASLSADLRKNIAGQRALITGLVKAMPEASFGFRPTPAQRTFAEAVLHVAGANSFLVGFTGSKSPGPKVDVSQYQKTFGLEAKTKNEILAALDAGYSHLEAAAKEFDDAGMLEEVTGPPWVGKVTRATMFFYILDHNSNLYGQMVVYLRLEGVTPPASGG